MELEFRAYDLRRQRMLKVKEIGLGGFNWIKCYSEQALGNDLNFGHNEYKLMQWTGLLDKNKTKIFDGDIILYSNSLESGIGQISFDVGFNIEWFIKTVKTENPVFSSPLFYFKCASELEVLGNKYQNNDLIERYGY